MPSRTRKRPSAASCILAMGLLLGPSAARGGVYFLKAEADTWLEEAAPGASHGADPELQVQTTAGGRDHAFLRFDLTGLPAGATVIGATLQLTVVDNDPSGLPVRIHRATDAWNETSATWTDTGLDYDSTIVYGAVQATANGYVFADVTALVREWSDAVYPNQGLALVASSADELSKFASREDGALGTAPLLMVNTLDSWPAMRVTTGSYNGNGVNNRAITGVGFRPDVVIIKGTNGLASVIKTSTLTGNQSKALGEATAAYGGRILALGANGFTLGNRAEVNASSVRYDWVALQAAPGEMIVGSYVGDGSDDRTIGGLGFLPGYALVFNENSFHAVQRFAGQPSDESFSFVYSAPLPNLLQDFVLDAFVVGSGDETNASGDTYHFVAFNTASATSAAASYSGSGVGPRDIMGAGFQPNWVLVKRNDISGASVFRSSSWSNDVTGLAGPGSYFVDGITAMRPDGFQVGSSGQVNAPLAGYHWLAFRNAAPLSTADVALSMTVDNAAPKEGESVTFFLALTNNGPAAATGVQVSEPLPPGLSYASHAATRGTYDGVTTGAWDVGTLAGGETAGLAVTATVDMGTGGMRIVNAAKLSAIDQADTVTVNNADSAAVFVRTSTFRVVSGTYMGSGAASRTISGIGFTPDAVIVKGQNNYHAIMRTRAMPAGQSKPLGTGDSPVTDGVTALVADGFGVGTNNMVNAVGQRYHWTAFVAAAGVMRVGGYIGDGTDNRDIGGVGFEPGYVVLLPGDSEEATQRYDAQAGDASLPFSSSDPVSNHIQSFSPDGFEVGTAVNLNGVAYYYAAWNLGTTRVAGGVYVGDGMDNRDITGVGFRPSYLLITRQENGVVAVQRTSRLMGDSTLTVPTGAVFTDGIQALLLDGFQVGKDGRVNGNGKVHYWTAFRDEATIDLAASMAVDNAFPDEGDTIRFTVTVSNNGPLNASGVAVTDALPAGLLYAGSSASQGGYDDATGVWLVGPLTVGGDATLWLDAAVDTGTAGSTLANTATVAGDQDDDVPANNTASASVTVRAADLAVTIVADTALVAVGDTLRHTVTVANGGPDTADSVEVRVILPAGLSFLADSTAFGAYDTASGLWRAGSIAAASQATLTVDATVDTGMDGTDLVTHARRWSAVQADPYAQNDADSVSVHVAWPVALVDAPATLYPETTLPGAAALALRIAVDNPSVVGVALSTASTISFTDGAETYLAPMANPTVVGAGATGFTLTFAASAVPASITPDSLYALTLDLVGSTDEGAPFAQVLVTTGTNAIYVGEERVTARARILGDRAVHPGVRAAALAFDLTNGYPQPRSLDTLFVTNASAGPGTGGDLDASIGAVRLFADVDSSGTLTPVDTLLASGSFTAGRVALAVGGSWQLGGYAAAGLVAAIDVDSTRARDGDALDLVVMFAADLVFVEPTTVDPSITPLSPVDSYGALTVDGMVAHQIAVSIAPPDTLYSGQSDRLLASLSIPGNGYAADTLLALNVYDASDGSVPGDFTGIRLYQDDGDGAFEPTGDYFLGPMVYSGDRWEVTGLSVLLGPAGNRFFVAADVSVSPTNNGTFHPGVPVGGIEVISGDDGPIDAPALAGGAYTIVVVQKVDVTNLSLPARAPHPGDAAVALLRARVQNHTFSPVTIDSLTLGNATLGLGTPAERDGEIASLAVYLDNGNGAVDAGDAVLAAGLAFGGGALTTPVLSVALEPGESADLLVAGDVDSTCAADGDSLRVGLDASGLHLDVAVQIGGAFPLTTPTARVVDGMMRHQIDLFPSVDSLLITSPTDNLVLEFALSGNGYRPDTLSSLALTNLGSATTEHIARLALYADGGDGAFDAGALDDIWLGDFVATGALDFSITGLTAALPSCGAGVRLYAAADIAASPTTGASVQFAIPVMGVTVRSGNDGPIDAPVVNPSIQLIPKPDEVTVFPYSVGDKRVYPGSQNVLNFGVGFYNGFDNAVVLDGVELSQLGSAIAEEITRVSAWADADTNGLFVPGLDVELAASSAQSAVHTLSGLGLALGAKRITYLFVAYDVSSTVRDSVGVNLVLLSDSHLEFAAPSVTVRGQFPADSPGIDFTDGMIASQLALDTAPSRRVAPGEQNVLAMGFTVPRNGYLADDLHFVTFENAGTAVAGTDVALVRLWAEAGGNATFDPASDRALATLVWTGGGWRNPVALDEPIPASGLRCYLSSDVASTAGDERTIQMRIPIDGIQVASGNDGAIDAAVVNTGTQTISTDPLITDVTTDRTTVSVGQTVVVEMGARNAGPTPLVGVLPSVLSVSGSGAATLVSGPVPATVDLAPGADTTFVWTFSASTAGTVDFCGYATNADSSEISFSTCAPTVTVQLRPAGVTLALADLTPPGVNRGQDGVRALRVTVAYENSDTLGALLHVGGIDLGVADAAGIPVAPNSRVDKAMLLSSTGTVRAFALADSTTSPVRLRFSSPIAVAPGEVVDVDVDIDVAPGAVLAPFRLALASGASVEATDANDGLPVALASGETFPWLTNVMALAMPADTVSVASTDTSTATVNRGQQNALALSAIFSNEGGAQTADVIVTRIALEFFDDTGVPLDPSTVIRDLTLRSGGNTLFSAGTIPSGGNRLDCSLGSALLLPAQSLRDLEALCEVRPFPAANGFSVRVAVPADIDARDNNSAEPVVVTGPFPLRGRTLLFQTPATGLLATHVSLAPETILPSATGVGLMRLVLAHPDTLTSSVSLDSVVVEFVRSDGGALPPGDYFNRLCVVHGPDTLAQAVSLSGLQPLVECRLSPPVVIAPGQSDSVAFIVDVKPSFTPAAFKLSVEREYIYAVDVNDGQRILGIEGVFPLESDLTWLRLSGNAITCALASRLPTNVTGRETDLTAFDLVVQNGSPAGYTPVEMRALYVRAEDGAGSPLAPGDLVSGARLMVADSLLATGTVGAQEIRFDVAPGAFVVDANASSTLQLSVDLAPEFANATFRFVVADTSATTIVDAATGAVIGAGTNGGAYPLATGYAHVLGADMTSGFTNYPNPFAAGRELTRITYYLEEQSRVRLRLYTLWGRAVATLLDAETRSAGLHEDITWDGRNGDGDVVNNGVYYLVLEVDGVSGGTHTLKRKVGVVR